AAPGSNILSTTPNNTYSSFSGTSMATPHVSGVAGLLLSQSQNLTTGELKWRILKGVDPKGLQVLTGGRLNAYNSLAFGLSTPAVTVDAIPVSSTTVSRGSVITYKISLKNNTTSTKSVTQTVFAQLPNGAMVTINDPATVNIGAGVTVTNQYSKTVPTTAPIGSYTLLGTASTSTSYDEDTVAYTITTN
ncbi:MAG: S8 family serine peptidase, partial [Deltaproteobacteria bacterium]|nr:S8 family serine peptidase [Deltaproteobacteria bacterium]